MVESCGTKLKDNNNIFWMEPIRAHQHLEEGKGLICKNQIVCY